MKSSYSVITMIVIFIISTNKWIGAYDKVQIDEILPRYLEGWSVVGEDKVYNRSTIFDYMNGAGEIYLAYDFQQLIVREYTKELSGSVLVEVYQMNSSEDAYGIFTHDTEGEDVNIGQGGVYGLGLLRFWKGHIFSRIFAEKENDDTRSFIYMVASKIADSVSEGNIPPLVSCLPEEGLIKKSIRYFHKKISLDIHYYLAELNILNLSEKTAAILSRYQFGNVKPWLLIVQYKDGKEAIKAYEQFNKVYFRDKPISKRTERIEEVEEGKFVSAKCLDRFLIFVFESTDKSLTKSIQENIIKKIKEVFYVSKR